MNDTVPDSPVPSSPPLGEPLAPSGARSDRGALLGSPPDGGVDATVGFTIQIGETRTVTFKASSPTGPGQPYGFTIQEQTASPPSSALAEVWIVSGKDWIVDFDVPTLRLGSVTISGLELKVSRGWTGSPPSA